MSYTASTDFVGLWRAVSGTVQKLEMPGLDFWVAAMGRSGLLSVSVSGTAPVANQSTTAWFQPASPSYSAEGGLYLWNAATSAYAAATPGLFYSFLAASAGASTASLFATTGGPPSNTVGNNGDWALRTDTPGGIYGPKAAGAWPVNPNPATSYSQVGTALDYLLGTPAQGSVMYRGSAGWQALGPGTSGQTLTSAGPGANPTWTSLSNTVTSAAFDAAFGATTGNMLYRSSGGWTALALPGGGGQVLTNAGGIPTWATISATLDFFGSAQGSVLYRSGAGWTVLTPGTNGYVLTTNGAGNNPSWNAPSAASVNSAALDSAFGATVGGVLIRGTSAWQNLGAGTAGFLLTANGAGAAASWAAAPTNSLPAPTSVGGIAVLKDAASRSFSIGATFTAGAGVTYNDNALGSPTPVGSSTTWQFLGHPQPQDVSGYTYHLAKRLT